MSQTIHQASEIQQQLPSHDTHTQPQPRTSTSRSPSRLIPERPPNERSSLSSDAIRTSRNYGSTPQPTTENNATNVQPTTQNGDSRRNQSDSSLDTSGPESDSGNFSGSDSNNNDRRKKKKNATKEAGRTQKWLRQFWTMELENKGSVARDHLALERTFLAWLRTSLAFASIGVAITQLFRLNAATVDKNRQKDADALQKLGRPLGGCFIGLAILALLVGVQRYYESQGWLLKGKYPASRGGVLMLSLVALIMVVASLVVVLALGTASA